MQLVGHAAVGITAAKVVGATNPVAAFFVGWASHYLADFFPHGDEQVGEWVEKGHGIRKLVVIVAIDSLVTLTAFAWYTSAHGFQPWAAAAALGSFVPDIMWGLEKVAKRKLFGVFERLHTWNHNFFKIEVPAAYGLPIQLALAAALWVWLVRS